MGEGLIGIFVNATEYPRMVSDMKLDTVGKFTFIVFNIIENNFF